MHFTDALSHQDGNRQREDTLSCEDGYETPWRHTVLPRQEKVSTATHFTDALSLQDGNRQCEDTWSCETGMRRSGDILDVQKKISKIMWDYEVKCMGRKQNQKTQKDEKFSTLSTTI